MSEYNLESNYEIIFSHVLRMIPINVCTLFIVFVEIINTKYKILYNVLLRVT